MEYFIIKSLHITFAGIWLANLLMAFFTIMLTRQVAKEITPLFLARLSESALTLLARLPRIKTGEKRL